MLELVTPFPCKQHPLRGCKENNDDVEEEFLEVCSTKHEPPLGASSGGATLSRCTFQTNTAWPLFSCTYVWNTASWSASPLCQYMQCIPTLLVLLAALHSLAFLFIMNNNASSSSLWIEERKTESKTHSSCFLIFRYVIVQPVIRPSSTRFVRAGKITPMQPWTRIFVG